MVHQLARELVQAMAQPLDPRDTRTVQEVIDLYLAHLGDDIAGRTRAMREGTLKLFSQQFGTKRISECNPVQLKHWLAERPRGISGWTKQRCNADIQRAFNWASNLRYIRENPFRGLEMHRAKKLTGRELSPLNSRLSSRPATRLFAAS
jgi:site-specific recombinase XerD